MMPDITKQMATLDLYASLMEEVKLREATVWKAFAGEVNLPPPYAREYCFLQIRMMIETIALGCLIVHGDIPDTQSRKFLGAWSADQIMKLLESLHPEFYPVPVLMTTTVLLSGQRQHHLEPQANDVLPKETLQKHYARCGEVLHRGSVKNLLKKSGVQSDLDEPKNMLVSIRKLLEQHLIALFQPDTKFVCLLSDPLAGGKTTAAIGFSGQ